MSRDKQIEGKMKVISDICPFYKECGTCEQCNTELAVDDEPCYWGCVANAIIRNGYRKASEVAREIFEEIEEMLNLQAKIVCETRDKYSETNEPLLSFIAMLDGRIYSLRVVEEHIAELKKKYIGKDTNVTTKESEKDNG